MTKKPPAPGMEDTEIPYKDNDGVEFDDAYWDAWLKRNADALNASIQEAEEQFQRGEYYTLEEVTAEVKAQAARRRAHKA